MSDNNDRNIAVISGWYPNSIHIGEGDFVKYQSQLISKYKYNIIVIHAHLNFRYLLNGHYFPKNYKSSNHQFFEYILESPFLPRNSSILFKLWALAYVNYCKSIFKSVGRPSLIHAHTYIGGYVAYLIKKSMKIPYVLTLHETNLLDSSYPKFHEQIIKEGVSFSDSTIAVSSFLQKNVEKITNHKIETIPNFIDFEKFTIKESANTEFTFVFVGELITRKNLNLLINAFKEVLDTGVKVKLKIIGDGVMREELKRKVISLGLNATVSFYGRIPNEDLSNVLSECHCMVLVSHMETFGIVLIEALACGLNIISSASGGANDIVNPSIGHIMLDTFCVHSLKRAMITAINVPFDSEKSRKYAFDKFSSKAIAPKYIRLYDSLIL